MFKKVRIKSTHAKNHPPPPHNPNAQHHCQSPASRQYPEKIAHKNPERQKVYPTDYR
jgi:hypothetical protein